MGEPKREGRGGLAQEGDGAPFGFVVLDREVDGARAAVDGNEQVSLAPFAVAGLQLGQVLEVDVDEAEVVVMECALALGGLVGDRLWSAVQSFGLEDAPDAVAVEVRQEMRDDEGEVVEGEIGRASQGADDGALLFGRLPGQPVRAGGAVEAIRGAALAPLAHGLGADAVAPGHGAAGLAGTGDLGPDGRGGAGIRVDVQHGSPPSGYDGETLEPVGPVTS